ncbi:hypothetical protein PZT57_28520 [Pseudomonas aeruginosa]|uniref:hypothetical protein n=1 Tax=Pseudomonas aeruginosa TaxID=287 RepID=UPI002B279D4A|nr:hypothetical protein [Pseudomonas aeruginosa]MEA8592598.1 hypothetical protein [Pseudomonas aeruginosa]
MNRHLLFILATAVAVASAGCTSSKHQKDVEVETHVQVPQRLAHEFYASWGHDGRGGAALRKPTYQHVMGSEDVLMTTQGKLSDWPQPKAPDGVVVTALNQGMNKAIFTAIESAPAAPEAQINNSSRLAALNATDDEYQRAYRKFCSGGGMAMTEREWELVALGGPNGIPANLRDRCMRQK